MVVVPYTKVLSQKKIPKNQASVGIVGFDLKDRARSHYSGSSGDHLDKAILCYIILCFGFHGVSLSHERADIGKDSDPLVSETRTDDVIVRCEQRLNPLLVIVTERVRKHRKNPLVGDWASDSLTLIHFILTENTVEFPKLPFAL